MFLVHAFGTYYVYFNLLLHFPEDRNRRFIEVTNVRNVTKRYIYTEFKEYINNSIIKEHNTNSKTMLRSWLAWTSHKIPKMHATKDVSN